MKRVFSVLYALTLLLPLPALAARLKLEPVEIIGYQGKHLRLSVDLDCGASFYGLLASVDKHRTLHLAAVVEQTAILCAGLPEAREIRVDYLATRGVAKIAPLAIDARRSRLIIAPATTIKAAPAQGGITPFSVVYEPRCGSPMGTIIRHTSTRHLEIGLAEHSADSATITRCQTAIRVATIDILSINPSTRVSPLQRASRTSLTRAYELHTAVIKPGSIRTIGPHGGVSLVFKRQCNDAPVGIVVSGHPQRPEIGVLVARYHNFRCPTNAPKVEWSLLSNQDLRLKGSRFMAALPPQRTQLQVTPPARYQRHARGLSIHYADGCSRTLGVIYSHDHTGKLAVGVVTSDAASSCKGRATEVSLVQPFIGNHVLTQDLAPLRLKG